MGYDLPGKLLACVDVYLSYDTVMSATSGQQHSNTQQCITCSSSYTCYALLCIAMRAVVLMVMHGCTNGLNFMKFRSNTDEISKL